jgi:uncharacterized protein with HEPN domain
MPKISSEVKKKYPLQWKEMYCLRNLISHSYHLIRKATIFKVCREYLPNEVPIIEKIEEELINDLAN